MPIRFYFSGVEAIQRGSPLYDHVVGYCQHRLQSCHGSYIKNAYRWMERAVELGVASNITMLLDSGAFTAWSIGKPMHLAHLQPIYEDIWNRFGEHFAEMWFINLDVIPGSRERQATAKEVEQALIDSDVNFKKLVAAIGPRVLPVFHQGEPWERLTACEDMSSYVCISPRQTLAEHVRVAWLNDVSTRHRPETRLHGLATTGARSVRACDWFSVDSASWVMVGAMGNILLPANGWVQPVSISAESPNTKEAGKHVANMPPTTVDHISKQVKHYGFDLDWLVSDPGYRMAFNLHVVQDAITRIEPIAVHQRGLF